MVSTRTRRLRQLLRDAMGAGELGRLIQQAREDAEMTQAVLAQRIGLSHPQSISRYERGETEVPAKRLRRIAEVTGKPLSFFLAAPVPQGGAQAADEALQVAADLLARLEGIEEAVTAGLAGLRSSLDQIDAGIGEVLRRLPPEADTAAQTGTTP